MPAFKPGVWNAWIFMSVFILQMLVMIFAGESVRKRSHVTADAKQSRSEKYTAVAANLVWFIALIYSVFLPLKLNTVWFYSGIVIFLIGLIILTIATYDFISTSLEQVITRGVYKFSRHPMYISTFFICTGAGIASFSWVFLILTIIMAGCFYKEMLVEERYCSNKYGRAYQEYMNRVPRWIGIPGEK